MKKYLSIEEQIELLEKKNLNFKSKKKAKEALQSIGYYKLINAYKIPFISEKDGIKEYREGVCFEDLYNLYEFDRKLKIIVFEATTNIEINIKSFIADVISKKYGVDEKKYLKKENFSTDVSDDDFSFATMKMQIKKAISKQIENNNPSIVWYKEKYNYFPFWVVSNILTLGTISKIYSKLKEEDKIIIAKNYKLPYDYIESYLMHVNMVRNICAHNSVLYRYNSKNSLPQKIDKVKRIYETLEIKINPRTGRYERGINDFLGTVIAFRLLLSKSDYNLFITQFAGLLSNLEKKINQDFFEIIMIEMGLNREWREIKKINCLS